MSKLDYSKTFYCEDCNGERSISHEHGRVHHPPHAWAKNRYLKPASTLPPGWSKTASTARDIEQLRREQQS